jgi:hypothetical protein
VLLAALLLATTPPRAAPVTHHTAQPQPSRSRPAGVRGYALAKVGPTQFACLDRLWTAESRWDPTADNPTSSAYGIPQLLGLSRALTPRQQVDAGLRYVHFRYGNACAAWGHWQQRRWY